MYNLHNFTDIEINTKNVDPFNAMNNLGMFTEFLLLVKTIFFNYNTNRHSFKLHTEVKLLIVIISNTTT